MKYFVIHHPTFTERREALEKQLNERGIQAEWITVCSLEEAQRIKDFTGSPLSLKFISMSMKHYAVFKKMVDEDIKYAIVFEDDTIFTEYFDTSKIPLQIPYVKLCKPVGDAPCTTDGSAFICSNNGCSDAYYLTKQFAELSLNNIQLRQPIDMEINNTLIKFYDAVEFLCIPMCYQLGPGPCELTDGETWREYVSNKTHKTFEYDELLSDPSLVSS